MCSHAGLTTHRTPPFMVFMLLVLPSPQNSPGSFQVTAEVVVAQPAPADRELDNGRFVRNRIVVVERGRS